MDKNDNKKFWGKWARRYDRAMSADKELYQSIADNIQQALDRDMTVLELACGTGLLSIKISPLVKHIEATDFSAEMIEQAKRKHHSARLHFSVQDATALPYTSETFDAVVISNALHIMPNPQKALSEIKRVLKNDGVLIAPTFTAAGSIGGRLRIGIMGLSGFRVFHKWTPESYLAFLSENGFEVQKHEVLKSGLTLTYAEAKKKQSI